VCGGEDSGRLGGMKSETGGFHEVWEQERAEEETRRREEEEREEEERKERKEEEEEEEEKGPEWVEEQTVVLRALSRLLLQRQA
jgi:hypothetical protein